MLDTGHAVREPDPGDGIAATFTEWVLAHRVFGGDFDQDALKAGVEATLAAYRRGLPLDDAFEVGRSAFYAALA